MKIAIPKEIRDGETRVATSPDMVKKLTQVGAQVVIETGAGNHCKISDDSFTEAGATIAVVGYPGSDFVVF